MALRVSQRDAPLREFSEVTTVTLTVQPEAVPDVSLTCESQTPLASSPFVCEGSVSTSAEYEFSVDSGVLVGGVSLDEASMTHQGLRRRSSSSSPRTPDAPGGAYAFSLTVGNGRAAVSVIANGSPTGGSITATLGRTGRRGAASSGRHAMRRARPRRPCGPSAAGRMQRASVTRVAGAKSAPARRRFVSSYPDAGATLDDIREAVTTLEEIERPRGACLAARARSRRGLRVPLRKARAVLGASETPPPESHRAQLITKTNTPLRRRHPSSSSS